GRGTNDNSGFWWEGVGGGGLLTQRGPPGGAPRHPPRPMCPRCGSVEWDTLQASGRGRVHSYVIPHHPLVPAFPEPYVVALVDLEEGTRLVTSLIGVPPSDVRIGMAVELSITQVDDDLALPLFRPAPWAAAGGSRRFASGRDWRSWW